MSRTSLLKRVRRKINKILYPPIVKVEAIDLSGLLRLGSDYGGWSFEVSPDLDGATIISCGFGTDGSFDVEFASTFRARVIVVDPTPNAIKHFEDIQASLGSPSSMSYVEGGRQPIEAYDLSKLGRESLVLEASALWTEAATLKFFAPGNPLHGSHSITNISNSYSTNTRHIEVPAVTLESLMSKYSIASLPLFKLDIEGAETTVIPHMLQRGIFPRQILIEFDELNFPSKRAKHNIESSDRKLREAGYECRFYDGRANYLYIREQGERGKARVA